MHSIKTETMILFCFALFVSVSAEPASGGLLAGSGGGSERKRKRDKKEE